MLGDENVAEAEPSMGGEDFSQYGLAGVPICMFRLGAVDQARLDEFEAARTSRRRRSTRRCSIRMRRRRCGSSVPVMVAVAIDLLPPRTAAASGE